MGLVDTTEKRGTPPAVYIIIRNNRITFLRKDMVLLERRPLWNSMPGIHPFFHWFNLGSMHYPCTSLQWSFIYLFGKMRKYPSLRRHTPRWASWDPKLIMHKNFPSRICILPCVHPLHLQAKESYYVLFLKWTKLRYFQHIVFYFTWASVWYSQHWKYWVTKNLSITIWRTERRIHSKSLKKDQKENRTRKKRLRACQVIRKKFYKYKV